MVDVFFGGMLVGCLYEGRVGDFRAFVDFLVLYRAIFVGQFYHFPLCIFLINVSFQFSHILEFIIAVWASYVVCSCFSVDI